MDKQDFQDHEGSNEDVRVEVEQDSGLVTVSVLKVTPQALESWTNAVFTMLETWPETLPYRALHDLSQKGVTTRYLAAVRYDILNLAAHPSARDQLLKYLAARPDFTARVAILVPISHSGQLGNVFAKLQNRNAGVNRVQYDVFYERQAALDWLNR
jgi:hypothetical protein